MFRPIRRVAAPGAKSAVLDCILFVTNLQEVQNRFPDGLPPLDPVDDMGIKDRGMMECVRVGGIVLRFIFNY